MSVDRRHVIGFSAAFAAAPLATACSGHENIPAPGVPRGPFDEDSSAEEVTEGIDLAGTIGVVTGRTSGTGFETIRVLNSPIDMLPLNAGHRSGA